MMKDSFTLIELIVVIAIIAILAAIIAPNAFKAIEKAKIARIVSDFKAIKTASGALYSDTGQWPHSKRVKDSHLLNEVITYLGSPLSLAGWDGPYLASSNWMHPWGGVYAITSNKRMFHGSIPYSPWYELSTEVEDTCYPSGPNYECGMPFYSIQRVDEILDDGVRNRGEFQYEATVANPGYGDVYWVLKWDICETINCW